MDRVPRLLFSGGWRFLVPYLGVYLSGWLLRVPSDALRIAFQALHLLMLGLFLRFAWQQRRAVGARELVYWLGIAVLVGGAGAFLEFPGDGWEHVRRIYAWEAAATPADHYDSDRFAYFFAWSLVHDVPIPWRRTAWSLLAAFWNLLLAAQLYSLLRKLGLSVPWSRAQVLVALLLMGNSSFAFFRYYGLASTAPAYVAYLRALGLSVELARGRRSRFALLEIAAALVVIVFDHVQELLLLLVSWLALGVYAGLRSPRWRRPTQTALLCVALSGLAAGIACWRNSCPLSLSGPSPPLDTAAWGGVPIWRPPYTDALGVHGYAGLAFALLLVARRPLVAGLVLCGPILLSHPVTGQLLLSLMLERRQLGFRLLYAIPTSLALVEALRIGLVLGARRAPAWSRAALAVLLLLPIAAVPSAPFRGRLWFLLHRPHPDLALEPLDATAEWFRVHRLHTAPEWRSGRVWAAEFGEVRRSLAFFREVERHPEELHARTPSAVESSRWWYERHRAAQPCFLVTDTATGFVLSAHLGLERLIERRAPPSDAPANHAVLREFLDYVPVCGLLLSAAPASFAAAGSRAGPISGHWAADIVRRDVGPNPGLLAAAARLLESGWRHTPVPPFYELYEPPSPPVPAR